MVLKFGKEMYLTIPSIFVCNMLIIFNLQSNFTRVTLQEVTTGLFYTTITEPGYVCVIQGLQICQQGLSVKN